MTPRELTLILLPNRRLLVLQRLARAADSLGRIDPEALARERRCFPELLDALVADGWVELAPDGHSYRLGDDPDDPLGVPKALPPYTPPPISTKGAPECAPSSSPMPAPR